MRRIVNMRPIPSVRVKTMSCNIQGVIAMARTASIGGLAFTGVALALTSLASSANTPDPSVGTWVLNAAKSTCNPPPAPKSEIYTIAGAPGGAIHETIDMVEDDGTSTHIEYTSARDGKYVPVTGSGYADSVSITRVDTSTTRYVFKKAGKSIDSGKFKVSKDGKTTRGSLSGKDADGAWKCQFVFDRQ